MDIKRRTFVTSMAQYANYEGIGLPEIAIAGKSNVGKSSLINCLCQHGKLAKVSGTPGKTRLLNVFRINEDFNLIDLPGYGFARVDKAEKARWSSMMEGYFRTSGLLCHVILLVDIRHEPTDEDAGMMDFLRAMGLPYTVVATKADKVSRGARMRHIAAICRGLLVQPWEVIPFSSEDGYGRDKLLERLGSVLAQAASAPAGDAAMDTALDT